METDETSGMETGEASGGSEHFVFDTTECRIVGTLIEKALATPEAYPLTVNALVAGCNQKSNRNPQLSLEPFEIEGALLALQIKGAVNVVERLGGRTTRYGHRLGERMGLEVPDLAVLAELLVRGPQTVNELVTRTRRLGINLNGEQLEAQLRRRAAGPSALYALNPRGSGERYPRWRHLLAAAEDAPADPGESPTATLALDDAPSHLVASTSPAASPRPAAAVSPAVSGHPVAAQAPAPGGDMAERLAALEARVAHLEKVIGAEPPPARPPVPERGPEKAPEAPAAPETTGWIDLD